MGSFWDVLTIQIVNSQKIFNKTTAHNICIPYD